MSEISFKTQYVIKTFEGPSSVSTSLNNLLTDLPN